MIAQGVMELTAAGIGAVASGGSVQGAGSALAVDANNRQLHSDDFFKKHAECSKNPSGVGCATILKMAGSSSQIIDDIVKIPDYSVAVNTDKQGNVVSYTALDPNTKQPLFIMEPTEFGVFRDATPEYRTALINSTPQWALDQQSAQFYLATGRTKLAAVHLGLSYTDPNLWAENALGLALSAGALIPKLVTLPATSAISKVGLQNTLAKQAGIPSTTTIVNNPASVWGASLNQLEQSFGLEGATVTSIPARASSSGNAQIFSVDGSASGIKRVQFSPDTSSLPLAQQSTHTGQYYKITYNDGSSTRIINPSTYQIGSNGFPSNTTYFNQQGAQINYNPATKIWSPVK